ncbi:MAG: hypothetical protein EB059_03175 [Alphaproteobacteria bacterium]|nr:hypothetical protein [Alphaproteobacteria bacterium]
MGYLKNQREEANFKKLQKIHRKNSRSNSKAAPTPRYKVISNKLIRVNFSGVKKPRNISAPELAKLLDGKWHGHSCNVSCPAHNDHTPSLSISESVDGSCLVYCHAGCSQWGVIEALIEKYGVMPNKTILKHSELGTPSREYNYSDVDGKIILKACRFNQPNGKKTIRYYIPSERRWGFPVMRKLYNLPQIVARPKDNVLIVEGEKTVEAAKALFPEYVVTTWPGGANAPFGKIDFSPLKGRNILIFADNDNAGEEAAYKIQAIVGGKVCRPSSNMPKGWDLADLSVETLPNHIKMEIHRLFSQSTDSLTNISSVTDLYKKDIPELTYVVSNLYPEGVTLLAGRPKIGKSFHMCQLCAAVARGDDFLGYPTTKAKVLYISFEDSERRLQKRLKALPRVPDDSFNYALTWAKPAQGGYELLERAINEQGYKLIVIDTLARFIGINNRGKGAGDGYSEDYEAIGRLVELAHRKNVCLVFIHHLRKAKADDDYFEAVAGSTGLTAAPDTIIILKKNGINNKATLMARGRDVAETILELEMINGIWENKGNLEELAKTSSPIKKSILKALSNKDKQTPAEIAVKIGENKNSVRVYLRALVKAGKLVCENGYYTSVEEDNGITG